MYDLQDSRGSSFFVEVRAAAAGRSVCRGAELSVDIAGESVFRIRLAQDRVEGTMEPFTQIAMNKIGASYTNQSAFDRDDALQIRLTGPDKHVACRVAVTIGKTEELEFWTLFRYPIVTMRSWNWAWKDAVHSGILYSSIFLSMFVVFVLFVLSRKHGVAEGLACGTRMVLCSIFSRVFL